MRITALEKEATRQRILECATDLFRAQGFDVTTTRDIAHAAGIATGTLFNYFATKEAIVASLARLACDKAKRDFARQSVAGELDERLFALIAAELRQLKSFRSFLAPVLERSFDLMSASIGDNSHDTRLQHLETVEMVLRQYGLAELPPLALQLYWMLYVGLLTFWVNDKSPKQEDTLALLDQSLAMFVTWLNTESITRTSKAPS